MAEVSEDDALNPKVGGVVREDQFIHFTNTFHPNLKFTWNDSIFSPLVQELLTYVHDTTHALHLLQNFKFPGPQRLIFTMDVQSLYTCIPHTDGLRALRFFLSRRPDQYPSTEALIRLAELVLTLNNFSFNSSHFL
eukprot:g12522.t1